jgi:tetratricopeptide (TPR) repeat protein
MEEQTPTNEPKAKADGKSKEWTRKDSLGCGAILLVIGIISTCSYLTDKKDKAQSDAKSEIESEQNYELGKKTLDEGDYETASSILLRINEKHKKYAEAQVLKQRADSLLGDKNYELGKKTFDKGDYETASSILLRIGEKHNKYAEASNMLNRILERQLDDFKNNFNKAAKNVERKMSELNSPVKLNRLKDIIKINSEGFSYSAALFARMYANSFSVIETLVQIRDGQISKIVMRGVVNGKGASDNEINAVVAETVLTFMLHAPAFIKGVDASLSDEELKFILGKITDISNSKPIVNEDITTTNGGSEIINNGYKYKYSIVGDKKKVRSETTITAEYQQ